MRPHRLKVTAFGPFPGTEELDLDEVSGAGPFLLRGATGAGKTSLLDAVGFALFGKVPGARGMKQLRSDHAPAGARTSVELWATIAGRAVHVVRTPDQLRPRSRGTGWTTDKASVTVRVARDLAALEADACDATYSGVQEANAELADLVGMTHEQFVQVVLLPQGDFARFLRAKDDERADVLRALFDTSRFTAVEQHLKARRDRSRDDLAAASDAVRAAAARVAEQAGLDDVPDDAADDLTSWAQTLLDHAAAAAWQADQQVTQAGDALRQARDDLDHASGRTRLLRDLAAAADRRRSLLADAPAIAERAIELDAADRAAEVVALHDAHQRAVGRAEEAFADAAAALADTTVDPGATEDVDDGAAEGADALPPELGSVDPEAVVRLSARLDSRVTSAVQAVARLEALAKDVDRWQDLQAELVACSADLGAARADVAATRARADELPSRVLALTVEHDGLRAVAAGLDAADRDVARWDELVQQSVELTALVEQADEAEREHLCARSASRGADDLLDDLRRARLDGMSTELAATLVRGEPCCVCGSTQHPAPAAGTGPALDADTEERARLDAAARAQEAARAGADLARAQSVRDGLHARLTTAADPDVLVPPLADLTADGLERLRDDLAARREQARAVQQAARVAAAGADKAFAELEALRTEQAEVTDALAAAEKALMAVSTAHAAASEESTRVRADLVRALGDRAADQAPRDVWTERTGAAQTRLDTVRAAAAAVTDLAVTLADVDRTRQAAAEICRAAGWDDPAAAKAADRPRAWRDRTREAVSEHARDLHTVTQRLAETTESLLGESTTEQDRDVLLETVDDQLAAARSREDELVRTVEHAESGGRDAHEVQVRRRGVLEGLQRAVPRLTRAEQDTGPLRLRAEADRALADLCSGSNDKGIPLSTYVLAAHLEHVVEAANQRLGGMSDGRYALVHVEEGEDRRRRAGLGLAVLDAWTGVQRPAGTLSGGETFLASLALALGLADVVTAEAGGVRIDALFVDEGFGTLDPDSLDRAMDVLDQLQEHGRMVGVVSHVGELQQRLPRQVHVESSRNGSTVRVLAG